MRKKVEEENEDLEWERTGAFIEKERMDEKELSQWE